MFEIGFITIQVFFKPAEERFLPKMNRIQRMHFFFSETKEGKRQEMELSKAVPYKEREVIDRLGRWTWSQGSKFC